MIIDTQVYKNFVFRNSNILAFPESLHINEALTVLKELYYKFFIFIYTFTNNTQSIINFLIFKFE